MDFRLLGPIEFEYQGRLVAVGRRQERSLLTLLVMEPGRPVGVDRIVSLLWPVDIPDRPRDIVQTYVSRVRATLRRAGWVAESHLLEPETPM